MLLIVYASCNDDDNDGSFGKDVHDLNWFLMVKLIAVIMLMTMMIMMLMIMMIQIEMIIPYPSFHSQQSDWSRRVSFFFFFSFFSLVISKPKPPRPVQPKRPKPPRPAGRPSNTHSEITKIEDEPLRSIPDLKDDFRGSQEALEHFDPLTRKEVEKPKRPPPPKRPAPPKARPKTDNSSQNSETQQSKINVSEVKTEISLAKPRTEVKTARKVRFFFCRCILNFLRKYEQNSESDNAGYLSVFQSAYLYINYPIS